MPGVSDSNAGRRISQMPGLDGGPYLMEASRTVMPDGYVERRRRTVGMQALQESIKEKQVSINSVRLDQSFAQRCLIGLVKANYSFILYKCLSFCNY